MCFDHFQVVPVSLNELQDFQSKTVHERSTNTVVSSTPLVVVAVNDNSNEPGEIRSTLLFKSFFFHVYL